MFILTMYCYQYHFLAYIIYYTATSLVRCFAFTYEYIAVHVRFKKQTIIKMNNERNPVCNHDNLCFFDTKVKSECFHTISNRFLTKTMYFL